MRKKIASYWFCALGMCCLLTKTSQAQILVMTPPEPPGGTPEIVGGRPAEPAEWPASLKFDFDGKTCSATVVGPNTVLTAAHCVKDGVKAKMEIGSFKTDFTCDQDPKYDADRSYDLAFCYTSKIIQPDTGKLRYERINVDPTRPAPGTKVILQGYGCRQADGLGPTGILWLGDAVVTQPIPGNDYIETYGGASVCSGDSGGAAFIEFDQYRRIMFSVVARGNISTRSLLTPVARKSVHDHIVAWMEKKKTTICGLDEKASNCHD